MSVPEIPGLRRAFRVGVMRRGVFKPIASVGLAKDGGVFVAPHQVKGAGWVYGTVTESAPENGEHVETALRPKLHYHYSGVVRVTLSGARDDLELRQVRFPSIGTLERAQIFSIVSRRLWEFESAPGDRRADLSTVEPKWPWGVAFSLALVRVDPEDSLGLLLPELSPFGLFSLEPGKFIIDLSAYGEQLLLLGSVEASHEPTSDTTPGTTVAAVGPESTSERSRFLGLWTDTIRNPMVKLDSDDRLLSGSDLRAAENSRVRSWNKEELSAYLFGR